MWSWNHRHYDRGSSCDPMDRDSMNVCMHVCVCAAGFAIGSAALVSLALYGAFVVRIRRAMLQYNTSTCFESKCMYVFMIACSFRETYSV